MIDTKTKPPKKYPDAGKKFTSATFFNAEMQAGITPHNPDYFRLMKGTWDMVNNIVHPESVLEIGAGVGTFGEVCTAFYRGIDPSPEHREFAASRGVNLAEKEVDQVEFDLIVSIEVHEHLTDKEIRDYFNRYTGKYFLFSSTSETTAWDIDWGHINVKPQEKWIELFAKNGYRLDRDMTLPTAWSKLFVKE